MDLLLSELFELFSTGAKCFPLSEPNLESYQSVQQLLFYPVNSDRDQPNKQVHAVS